MSKRKSTKPLRPARHIIEDIRIIYGLTDDSLAKKLNLTLDTVRRFHIGPYSHYTSYPTLQKAISSSFVIPEGFFDEGYERPNKPETDIGAKPDNSTKMDNTAPQCARRSMRTKENDDALQRFMAQLAHKEPKDVKIDAIKAKRLAEIVKTEFPEIAENILAALDRHSTSARDLQMYKYCSHTWSVPWEDPVNLMKLGHPVGVNLNDPDAVAHYYMYNFSECKKCGIPYRIGGPDGLTDNDYDQCALLYNYEPVISVRSGCSPSLSIVEAYARAKYGIDFMSH